MIKLNEASLLDGLPKVLSQLPEVQALSHAVDKAFEKYVWTATQRLRVYSNVDHADETLIDALAFELQVPAYRQDYDINVKRQLVKGAMSYWIMAGSAQAVEDLCNAIFGDAKVIEWFDFNGDEGTYKVTTTNPGVSAGDIAQFEKVAESVKRLSQHLISVDLELSVLGDIRIGGFLMTGTTETIKEADR